jgi:predicted DNA-binding helix-hairpin-helix protein
MIVGADTTDDAGILKRSASLYAGYGLKRVYYSAFSPIPDATSKLPLKPPPLMREHRLYQADWLMRFYGFRADEIAVENGFLDLKIDPKLAWALSHRELFPLDINRADRELLLRVPGLGVRSVNAIIAARRHHRLRLDEVARLCSSAKKVRPFIVADDWTPGASLDDTQLRSKLTREPQQLSLF